MSTESLVVQILMWSFVAFITVSIILVVAVTVGYIIHRRQERKRKDHVTKKAIKLARESKERDDEKDS